VKVSDEVKRLGVSTKSASRCFDELEYLNIDVLGMKGKSRVIDIPDEREQLWQQIKMVLRNPVIRRFILREDIKFEKKAGISALCEYSLLSDNVYPTYAVTKKELKDSGVKAEKQVSELEEIGCVVLELGYFIDFWGKGLQDPVWEYYAGDSWKEGMIQEIREDRLCGFIGKTVIHPSQIPVVNRAYQVSRNDYLDARAILNWNADSASLVAGSKTRERMNEYKTHLNWAKKTVYLSEVFGITE